MTTAARTIWSAIHYPHPTLRLIWHNLGQSYTWCNSQHEKKNKAQFIMWSVIKIGACHEGVLCTKHCTGRASRKAAKTLNPPNYFMPEHLLFMSTLLYWMNFTQCRPILLILREVAFIQHYFILVDGNLSLKFRASIFKIGIPPDIFTLIYHKISQVATLK